MKILVTGGAGYIGSVLAGRLLEKGHKVTVLDRLFFGEEPLKQYFSDKNFRLVKGDINSGEAFSKALGNNKAVIHLAALVGDPACRKNPELARKTNFDATLKIAHLCKKKKIRRFVFASTCSVYGFSNSQQLTEESNLNPVSLYAITRLYSERALRVLSNSVFNPTILRFGTVYGLSQRMRFDLVVNTLSMKAATEGKISIFGGNQWRPFVHVSDIVDAISLAIESPVEKTAGEIFNVGSTEENYLIRQIGQVISELYPSVKVDSVDEIDDPRSYNVNFDKIQKILGFRAKRILKDGVKEMVEAIKDGSIKNTADAKYYNHLV